MAARRLKVLFVTPWYPHPENIYDGIFVREHAMAAQLYHDATVLHCWCPSARNDSSPSWKLVGKEDVAWTSGIPTYRLCYGGLPWVGDRGGISFTWAAFWGMRYLIRKMGRPDVIHAHVCLGGLPAVIVGRLYGIPTVVSEHWSVFLRHWLTTFQRLRARIAFGLCDLALPVSQVLQQAIESYGMHPAFRVVPNTVNTDLFVPAATRNRCELPIRLLFVGSLKELKGLPWLMAALASLRRRDWVLDIVGDGPEHDSYQRLSTRLGLAEKVTFHGAKSKEQVADFFRDTDLFVLPSLLETFSVVTIEAMASGVPVLVTRCGGPEALVSEDAGMVVPPRDATALAVALDAMLERVDTYDRQAIATSARERFGYQAVGAALSDAYLEAIELRRRR